MPIPGPSYRRAHCLSPRSADWQWDPCGASCAGTRSPPPPPLQPLLRNLPHQETPADTHTANVMKSLGLPEEDVDRFCTDMLFPKLA